MSEILLPRRDVEKRVGLGRSAIYRRLAEGTFPQPVRDLNSASVWWIASEIDAWVQARIDVRNMGSNVGRKSA